MHTELESLVLNHQTGDNMPLPLKLSKFPSSTVTDRPVINNTSIKNVIKQKLELYSSLKWESDQENAFFVCDLGEVYRQHLRWKSQLPRIEPFFGRS